MLKCVGLGENTGTPVYRGIPLAWYVPGHTCPYRGILVFLFRVTENLNLQNIDRLEVETASSGVFSITNH